MKGFGRAHQDCLDWVLRGVRRTTALDLTDLFTGLASARPSLAVGCPSFRARLILAAHQLGRFTRSCCQIRTTRQPLLRRMRFTRWSRALFAESFFVQNGRLLAGVVQCFGQPCQKQPSTKTARREARNTKSGLPNMVWFLLHPTIPRLSIKVRSLCSVARFPFDRIRDITLDRNLTEKTSAMNAIHHL